MIGLARIFLYFYKKLVSPVLGDVCRFEPSCSDYAVQALEQHGFLRGASLALWRLLRCHPYCSGGVDPVPPAKAFARRGKIRRLKSAGADPHEPAPLENVRILLQ